ncbi:MAG: STAS domain-containing protein [Anaerolineae bacterium]|nr:STAS domain-containing protein [Anaerolineae bacterium]
MPIHIHQLASDYILCYRFSGHITHADLEELRVAEEPFFDQLPPERCHSIIADLSDLHTLDATLFPPLQEMRLVCDTRVCVVVVVGANPYLRALAISLGLTSSQHGFLFRSTVEEALAVLGADVEV